MGIVLNYTFLASANNYIANLIFLDTLMTLLFFPFMEILKWGYNYGLYSLWISGVLLGMEYCPEIYTLKEPKSIDQSRKLKSG